MLYLHEQKSYIEKYFEILYFRSETNKKKAKILIKNVFLFNRFDDENFFSFSFCENLVSVIMRQKMQMMFCLTCFVMRTRSYFRLENFWL